MEEKKNYYEKRAKKRSLLGEITAERSTDEDFKNSAIETGKDLLVGAVGGGIVGAMLGKFSLLAGTGVTFLSHYFKKHLGNLGRAFGIAMMSSGTYENLPTQTVSGTEDDKGMVEGLTDRVMQFKEAFSSKLFLDKILKDKTKETKQDTKAVQSSQSKPAAKQVETTPTKKLPTATPKENTEDDDSEDGSEKSVGSVRYFIYPGATMPNKAQTQMARAELSDFDKVEDELNQSAAEFKENGGAEGIGDTEEMDPTEKNY